MTKRDECIKAWQDLADHTASKCGGDDCRGMEHSKYRCCDPMYCEIAIQYAKERWDTILERTGNPDMPLMGTEGCTAAPHLRMMCTAHLCIISSLGFDPRDPDWTKKYFELRQLADALSWAATEEETPDGD